MLGISGRFHGQPRIRAKTRDRRAHQQGRILLVVRENVVAPRFARQLMRGNQHAAREAAPSRLRRESRTSDSKEPPPDIVQDQCDPGIDAGGSLLSPRDNIDCSTFVGNFVSSPNANTNENDFCFVQNVVVKEITLRIRVFCGAELWSIPWTPMEADERHDRLEKQSSTAHAPSALAPFSRKSDQHFCRFRSFSA